MNLPAFMTANKKEIRFLFLLLVFFVLLQVVNYAGRTYTDEFLVKIIHVQASSALINFITPAEKTYVTNNVLRSETVALLIDTGCDGVESFILLISAILAYPTRARKKIWGIVACLVIIYIFNLIRIIGIYYVIGYHRGLFDIFHVYVGQTFMIIVGMLVFVIWAFKFEGREKKAV